VTITGTGFQTGKYLTVRFLPVSGGRGGFFATSVAVMGPSTISASVPAGEQVQDYTVSVTNGDGSSIPGLVLFTVTP
jgi:hypothetical protein